MSTYLARLRSILTQHPRPLLFLISRILMTIPWSRHLSVRREGYVLNFFPTALSAAMWADTNFRADEERFLRDVLRPGDVAIDVGANVGSTALSSAIAVGPKGHVLAVEPHPRIFSYLKANIARNAARQIEAMQCALSHEVGEAGFTDRRSDDQNAISPDGRIAVPRRRLDDIAPRGKIALLKVDVEGHEYFVFKGGKDTLERTDIVYFEYVPNIVSTGIAAISWQPLLDAGFQIYEKTNTSLRLATLPPKRETMLIALKDAEALAKRTGWIIASDGTTTGSDRETT
jgi:FkbM family methyltransferase